MPGPDFEVEPEHVPMRGDAMEKWLKATRDRYADDYGTTGTVEWSTLDKLLDEYRLRADTGLTLAEDIADADECGTGFDDLVHQLDDNIAGLRRRAEESRQHTASRFRDERLGARSDDVKTANLPCRCDHDLPGALCRDHGEVLQLDRTTKTTTCNCPKSL